MIAVDELMELSDEEFREAVNNDAGAMASLASLQAEMNTTSPEQHKRIMKAFPDDLKKSFDRLVRLGYLVEPK